ncbi:hypothetical protein DACRYDRAFT_113999 [Dacryopinax primogenitus]|uniref:Uncharacterized protein n=1 Tax=Dacryopinax primogenitus (strain DJM 731) TaxID=1858805 RepID=M5G7A2_DACPD|nr:uncharacterized protein DACRYDRAFT_113999 [Dacryopinax primogenitus]EJU04614.1 hypothetical protein DACRYDRAFT_113999 [Dacryopinax primogenitus]
MSNNPYNRSNTSVPPSINEPLDAPPAYTPVSPNTPNTGKSANSFESKQDTSKLSVPGASMPNASVASFLDEERELPPGWIRQWDPNQKHHFYVDTKAKPPRSIWVHPYDDPTFIASIPDSSAPKKFAPPPGPPPEDQDTKASGSGSGKKGVFGNVKDKLQGTPEERQQRRIAAEKREADMRRKYEQRQQDIQRQGYPGQYNQAPPQGYAPQQGYYPPQQGGYYGGYAPQPYYQPQYAPPQQQYQQRSSGWGGGGMALPLLGGLAGGFLLGDILGDMGDGGDW